ncbi:hypothetical protein [Aliiroseovarius sp. S253]|uniref:hypothetical protein n=1 Tax=Aliiroseovarius sp. S253 TaxID=3415133 RepID=UPI003C7A9D8D
MTYQASPAIKALLIFLYDRYEAVQNAAFLLGGREALKRVQHLVEHLRTTRQLNRHTKIDLIEIHKVLSLQYVGDPQKVETSLFADLEPDDPVVEEICVLTDELTTHLEAIAAEAVDNSLALELAA